MKNNKKKIGIVTFWNSNDNYGQQLQCWALQQVLRQMGHTPFLIRYKMNLYPIKKCSGLKYCKHWLVREIRSKYNRRNFANVIKRRFPLFRLLNISKTFKVYGSLADIEKCTPQADVYITGSDQVWGFDKLYEDLKVYFLQFGSKSVKRIAYAPSIAHDDYPDELKEDLRLFLNSFDAISVREQSAIKICNGVGFDAENVLDPSMLLREEDYVSRFRLKKNKGSVFIYSLNYDSKEDVPFTFICDYAKRKNIPVVVTTSSGYISARRLFEEVNYIYPTISKWIETVYNADLVVTASFHGIMFSILLHRKFIFTPLKGSYSECNNRTTDMLYYLGLDGCIWDGENELEIIKKSMDWKSVDERLDVLRQSSLDFLRRNI